MVLCANRGMGGLLLVLDEGWNREGGVVAAPRSTSLFRRYIGSIPKTLGTLYDSLGFMIPQKLAGVLPLDFFSDDSMTQESRSPLLSVPLLSSAQRSVSGGTESDQLEELRTRSAKKRRWELKRLEELLALL